MLESTAPAPSRSRLPWLGGVYKCLPRTQLWPIHIARMITAEEPIYSLYWRLITCMCTFWTKIT